MWNKFIKNKITSKLLQHYDVKYIELQNKITLYRHVSVVYFKRLWNQMKKLPID